MKDALELCQHALIELEESKATGPHVDCAKADLKATIANLTEAIRLSEAANPKATKAKTEGE